VKLGKFKVAMSAALGATLLALGPTLPARAQTMSGSSTPMLKLYVDPVTGQVFTRPGKGRALLTQIPVSALDTSALEKRVEQKTQAQIQQTRDELSDLAKKNQELSQQNAHLAKQVSDMKPAWQEFGNRWFKKITIGTLVYADYRFFSHTGFGPQFLTQETWPGPGNNGFNSFDISRAYLDFKFTPTEDLSMRVTPNIYANVNPGGGQAVGRSTAWNNTDQGNLNIRLKYAYVDFNTLFRKYLKVDALNGDKITFGQQQNPLVDWEENLWGFRYVALTPWNYLSLSSTQVGIAMKGPIKFHETQYADYDFGVYNNASFHQVEQSNTKQVMGRITINPLGAKTRYDSLGITAFVDYGWGNNAPDTSGFGGGKQTWRNAFLLHYTGKGWGLIGEYDIGKNAFSSGNLYSGAGPLTTAPSTYGPWNTMVAGIQNNGQATQQGYDFLGHVDIPHSPFTIFGLFQQWLPNTKADKNPLDFQRWVVGLQYKYSQNLRFAIDSQNLMYYHSQFTFPSATFGSTTVPTTPFAVPWDTHAFYLNMEFNY
jgi:hypothetical protein